MCKTYVNMMKSGCKFDSDLSREFKLQIQDDQRNNHAFIVVRTTVKGNIIEYRVDCILSRTFKSKFMFYCIMHIRHHQHKLSK